MKLGNKIKQGVFDSFSNEYGVLYYTTRESVNDYIWCLINVRVWDTIDNAVNTRIDGIR